MVVDNHQDGVGMTKDATGEVTSIVENNSTGVEIQLPEHRNIRNGLMIEDLTPERCQECKADCCGEGRCNKSQVSTRKSSNPSRDHDRLNSGCETKEKKSILFRKSTALLLSGFCMLGVTGLSIADIVTDVLTAREYYKSGWITAFILSLVFLFIPPILLTAGIIRRRDDSIRNTTTESISCCAKFFIVILNVPLKLYMIWLQLVFSYTCFKKFHNWRKSRCLAQEETLMSGYLSHFITELTLYKLWNSIFESMPQLLLTIHVIMDESANLDSGQVYLLIVSSLFSFVSLCVGILFYVIKSKEAESKQKNARGGSRVLRSKSTRLGIPQIILILIYTVCFLAARTLSLSYFIIFFEWYAIIVPALHWIVVFIFFAYRRYVNQRNMMQHYRMTSYQRRSSSFVYVFVHSVISVFIHIKPECEEVLDQPRYYKIFYYLFYTIENCIMILMPLMLRELPKHLPLEEAKFISDDDIVKYRYFAAMYCVLGAVMLGAATCSLYHFMVHKSAEFTREEVFGPCCKCCYGPGGFLCFSCSSCSCCREKDDTKIFIACKNVQTHEIYKASLRDVKHWKESTESKLLNEKLLRPWKRLHNSYKNSVKKKRHGSENGSNPSESSADVSEQPDPTCPYTMRRSGLHMLSDPKGNLFYAPVADIKARTIAIF